MPVNKHITGQDVELVINVNGGELGLGGAAVSFIGVTGFSSRQDTSDLRVKQINGEVRHLVLPDGWSGTFDITRQALSASGQDITLDDFFSRIEAEYYKGDDMGLAEITQRIKKQDGNYETYKFKDCALKLEDAGDYSGDSTVSVRVGFMASKRVKATGSS